MGNQELAQRIVRSFVNDMLPAANSAGQAVSNCDAAQVPLIAHSIKGSAANVGDWKCLTQGFERVKPLLGSFQPED